MRLFALLAVAPLLAVANTCSTHTDTVYKTTTKTELTRPTTVTKSVAARCTDYTTTTEHEKSVTTKTSTITEYTTPTKSVIVIEPTKTVYITKTDIDYVCESNHYKRDLVLEERDADANAEAGFADMSNAERLRRHLPLRKPGTRSDALRRNQPSCLPTTVTSTQWATKTEEVCPTVTETDSYCRTTKTVTVIDLTVKTATATVIVEKTAKAETITSFSTPTKTATTTHHSTVTTKC